MAHSVDFLNQSIEEYLDSHEQKEIIRFIACGSVDDGKSSLIGRLLYDSQKVFDDQLKDIKTEADLALLLDGLESEIEQGITIDVAYKYFSTKKKKYIIADTPGHDQYTRNMATGASTADVAVILIDARKGLLHQTKRHSYIVSLLGIKKFIIAINKIDLVDYAEDIFEEIKREYQKIIPNLENFEAIEFDYIPVSALHGDNVVNLSIKTPWYKGKPIMELLDNLSIMKKSNEVFIFPVQYINRPNSNFRAYCGSIVSGELYQGDEIIVLPSKKRTNVQKIISQNMESSVSSVSAKMAVSIILEDELDISRGDVIVKNDRDVRLSASVNAIILWMNEEAMNCTQSYIIKLSSSIVNGVISEIEYKKDLNTFGEITVNELHLNDIAMCKVEFDRKIVCTPYKEYKELGSFIIIDRYTNETLGVGMIDLIDENQDNIIEYTDDDRRLNKYIRKKYPEWNCREI